MTDPTTTGATATHHRQRKRDEMMARIIATARVLMREQGVGALNLNEVARRIGIKTPSLYEYFPGKMAFYDAVFRVGIELFAERMAQAITQPVSFWSRMQAAMEAHMRFALENPDLYQLVFERPVPGFVPSAESLQVGATALQASLQEIVGAIEGGSISPDLPPEQALDLVNAIMHGLTALQLANEPQAAVGSGRFGSLVTPAIRLLEAAWSTVDEEPASPDSNPPSSMPHDGTAPSSKQEPKGQQRRLRWNSSDTE